MNPVLDPSAAARRPRGAARTSRTALWIALVPACSGVASAQTPAASSLEPVVVTATRTERKQLDVPASVDVIDRDEIRDAQLRVNLSESLTRVPGVVVLNRQNYAQDLQISIRGFGSRSTFGVRGVRLYVDGVPATFPDGQGQVSHFPLNLADRIEVLRGPFSALYGNSSGGVIALSTVLEPQEPRFELSGAGGTDGTWRGGLSALGGSGAYAFALDASRFETDGAREHSAARRDTLALRVAFLDTPLGRVKLSANSVAMPDSQDPLGLTRAQFDADPDQVASVALQFDTRKTTRQKTLGGEIQSRLAESATMTTAFWIGTRGVIQFQSIPVGVQTPATQPGGVIDFDRTFGGADVRATFERGGYSLTGGLTAERLDEDRRGYNNFTGTGPTQVLGVLGALRRDETNRIESVDPYVQGEVQLADRWRALAGVRATEVKFRSNDRYIVGTNGDDSGSASFSGVNPTAGIVFRPTPSSSVYASYGRGFETPTLNELAYRADGSAGFNTDLREATSNNVEVGAKTVIGDSLRATLALFSVRTTDDIVVRTNTGGRSSFTNVARTKRQGVEVSAEWRFAPGWSAQAALAALEARFDTDFLTCGPAPCTVPTLPVARDNKLPGVPEQTLFLELRRTGGWVDVGLEFYAQSPLYVDDRNTDRAAGYGTLSLSVARSLDVMGRKPRVFARVDNALDKRYAGSVIVNEGNGRFFEPAPGRTWLVGFDWPL